MGLAPMLAMSLKLTAAAVHPNCSKVIPFGKCLPAVRTSVDTTVSPLHLTTAASSPGPRAVLSERGRTIPLMRSTSSLSPTSPNAAISEDAIRFRLKVVRRTGAGEPLPNMFKNKKEG